ncbi:hypothetical protein M426DRAFT_28570 [Hypoxylon sp. CI-4A]|nr:hypothetical protein M426DRAFT_28570 [Hypoxylon sp. CI-4A]
MDDPWGSPWASSETTSKHDPPTPSPPKNLLSPPPRAFFGSTSNLQSQSPWGTGDGFGDWTNTEQTDIAADWGVWAEPTSDLAQPSPRPDDVVKGGSIALPSSAATSPGLRPLPRSRASSVYRHHSPDPWVTEASLQQRKTDSPILAPNTLEIFAADALQESSQVPRSTAQQESVISSSAKIDDIQTEAKNVKLEDDVSDEWRLPPLTSGHQEFGNGGVDPVPKVEIHDALSRPSSTFSVDSSSKAERPDSPITSIDEDPTARLQTSRKVSGKVQELVGMYDDIAKGATEEPLPSERLEPSRKKSRERSPSQARSTRTENELDFGDFEDAKSEYADSAPNSNTSSASSGRSTTPKGQFTDVEGQNQEEELVEGDAIIPGVASIPVQQLIEKFGPIQFNVDLQSIDKVFPDLVGSEDRSINDEFGIPDRIIEDSFETISERKTWYRISRYGSIRKHDSGDDENYHRVEWSTSHLHNDVIKIVRRWMEVDSIAGRATLGASNRTSVFNWDSSAAPVDLGKVFARKAAVAHSRDISLSSAKQGSERSIQSPITVTETRQIKSPIQPPEVHSGPKVAPIASFGWSSDTNKSQSVTHPIVDNGTREAHAVFSNSVTSPAVKTEIQIRPTAQIPGPQEQIASQLEDEDDDWGEMVSSPRVDSYANPIPILQSLDNANATTSASLDLPDNDPSQLDENDREEDAQQELTVAIPESSTKLSLGPMDSSSASIRVDTWPSADFSIFENSSTRTPKSSKNDSWSQVDFSIFESPMSVSTRHSTGSLNARSKTNSEIPIDNIVETDTTNSIDTNPPLKAVLGPIQKPSNEKDQDDIVRNIIQNLPDLTYMLR